MSKRKYTRIKEIEPEIMAMLRDWTNLLMMQIWQISFENSRVSVTRPMGIVVCGSGWKE